MNTDLNIVLEAAKKLPPDEQRELIIKLTLASVPIKTPGLAQRHFGTFTSGDVRSSDNEKIDEDLAREYADSHEFEN